MVTVRKSFVHPGDTDGLRNPNTHAWTQEGTFGGGQIHMLVVDIKPCTTYRFSIEVTKVYNKHGFINTNDIETIRDVILPPMAYVSNFKLPLLSQVSFYWATIGFIYNTAYIHMKL